MDTIQWFYIENGQPVGPVPHEQLCGMFASGRLTLATMVWTAQFKAWTLAADISGFRELARNAPPQQQPPPMPPLASVVALPAPPPPPTTGQQAAEPAAASEPATASDPPSAEGESPSADDDGAAEGEAPAAPAVPAREAWVRLCARWIDLCLVAAAAVAFMAGLGVNSLWFYCAAFFAWVFVEAALLAGPGATPGKALLGVQVRGGDGQKLSFGAALLRAFLACAKGLAAGAPVVGLVTQIVSYKRLRTFGATSWDDQVGCAVRVGPVGPGRAAGALASVALAIAVAGAATVARSVSNARDAEAAAVYGEVASAGD